jgi:L-threonylcarbamoyladenylate synthase
MTTERLTTSSSDLERAATLLRDGDLVAIPTETVYGLAADIAHPDAVERIYAVKGRPVGHPLICHVADVGIADTYGDMSVDHAMTLATACWPGPLTLLLPRRATVPDIVTGGRATVGLRVPAHPLTSELLARHGGALAAPSANRFGRVSPTSAAHVLDDIGELLDPDRDLILDGGPCPVGVESTIVDLTVSPPQVLRHGGIAPEEIARLLRIDLAAAAGESRTSGMLASHYAPSTPMRLVDDPAAGRDLRDRTPGSVLIDRTDDLVEAARSLYADLRTADRPTTTLIIAVLPPATGLGHALRDRLVKAAAR